MKIVIQGVKIEHVEFNKFEVTLRNEEKKVCEIAVTENGDDSEDMYFWKRSEEDCGEKHSLFHWIKGISGDDAARFSEFRKDCVDPKMQIKKTEKKMGGARKGAGRKRLVARKETLSLRVTPDIKRWIESKKESAGVIFDRLCNEHMKMELKKEIDEMLLIEKIRVNSDLGDNHE
jgi:hypothetical protein